MCAMVPGVELLDRQIIDAHQLYAQINKVLCTIGSEKRVVRNKFTLRKKCRVARANQNTLGAFEILALEMFGGDGPNVVRKSNHSCGPDQSLERNPVHRLAIVEEMSSGVGVRAGVRSKSDERNVGARARGDRLLELDAYLGIAGINKAAGFNRDREVVDAAHGRRLGNSRARPMMEGWSIRWRSV